MAVLDEPDEVAEEDGGVMVLVVDEDVVLLEAVALATGVALLNDIVFVALATWTTVFVDTVAVEEAPEGFADIVLGRRELEVDAVTEENEDITKEMLPDV